MCTQRSIALCGCGSSRSQLATVQISALVLAHRLAVVALGFMGRLNEGMVAARRFIELSPTFTVRKYLCVVPYRDAEMRNRVANIYRAVGVSA